MKREVLNVLKQERDALSEDLRCLQQGQRRVLAGATGQDVTQTAMAELEARLLRLEELIAASEARLA